MASTKNILTSIHGRRLGIAGDGKLVVNGRTATTQDDAGLEIRQQGAPAAVDVTATLTIENLRTGIITSTTAAAVTGTLPTGTLTDAGFTNPTLAIGEAFDWSVSASGANAFTVAAGVDHTLVGSGIVATATSSQFRTRKIAANSFTTYRI